MRTAIRRKLNQRLPELAHSLVCQPILPLWFARGGRHQTIHLKSIKDVLCSCGGWLIGEPARWECPFKLIPAPFAIVLVNQPEKSQPCVLTCHEVHGSSNSCRTASARSRLSQCH